MQTLFRALLLPVALLLLPLHQFAMNVTNNQSCRVTAGYLKMHPDLRWRMIRQLLTLKP